MTGSYVGLSFGRRRGAGGWWRDGGGYEMRDDGCSARGATAKCGRITSDDASTLDCRSLDGGVCVIETRKP